MRVHAFVSMAVLCLSIGKAHPLHACFFDDDMHESPTQSSRSVVEWGLNPQNFLKTLSRFASFVFSVGQNPIDDRGTSEANPMKTIYTSQQDVFKSADRSSTQHSFELLENEGPFLPSTRKPSTRIQPFTVFDENLKSQLLTHSVMDYIKNHKEIVLIQNTPYKVHFEMIDFSSFSVFDDAELGSSVKLSKLKFRKFGVSEFQLYYIAEGETPYATFEAYSRSYGTMRLFLALTSVKNAVIDHSVPYTPHLAKLTRSSPYPFWDEDMETPPTQMVPQKKSSFVGASYPTSVQNFIPVWKTAAPNQSKQEKPFTLLTYQSPQFDTVYITSPLTPKIALAFEEQKRSALNDFLQSRVRFDPPQVRKTLLTSLNGSGRRHTRNHRIGPIRASQLLQNHLMHSLEKKVLPYHSFNAFDVYPSIMGKTKKRSRRHGMDHMMHLKGPVPVSDD